MTYLLLAIALIVGFGLGAWFGSALRYRELTIALNELDTEREKSYRHARQIGAMESSIRQLRRDIGLQVSETSSSSAGTDDEFEKE